MKTRRIDADRVRIPREGKMLVDGVVYASERLFSDIAGDASLTQVANVAHLPGIVGASLAMPDIHWGYGFPIGGVAAMDAAEGVISPGGVGYDINCGVRLIATDLDRADVDGRIEALAREIFATVPAGVGRSGSVRLSKKDLDRVLSGGARWAVEAGYGEADDAAQVESGGRLEDADPDAVGPRARERGLSQVGTLGSGNHFVEIGTVDEIYAPDAADAFGLRAGQLTVLLHSGSRGLGHQVADDAIHRMGNPKKTPPIPLPDRQLACAPFDSKAGRFYFGGMNAAANFAFANRQVMTHFVREAFARVLGAGPAALGMRLVYDVAHNIAKVETHVVDGKPRRLVVHRKGATRAFGPGHPDVPEPYRAAGQPVLVPGDMGRSSYVLAGTAKAMAATFGSTCHGAGRRLSRKAATRAGRGRDVAAELAKAGVFVMARERSLLAEEMPEAYKDVSDVVDVVESAGISRKVARLRPLAVVKG